MKSTYYWTIGIIFGYNLITLSSAKAADYNCIPLEVTVLQDRAHVECAAPASKTRGGYPTDTGNPIRYFAVPLSNQGWANRFIYIADIAITSGLPIQFKFTSGDYRGEAFGCVRANCRTPWSFTLLKTATIP